MGLDRISARLLKESVVPILTRLFNRSIEPSTFPSIWKCGKVTALFKGGDRTDSNNYRPITVLPTISKILERAVHQQLYEVLSANELLTPNQFGFRPKLSTVTALAHFTDNILQSLHKGGYIWAAFLDLSKAFEQWTMYLLSKNSRPLELVLKLWSGLPHTLKVGIKSHPLKSASRLNKRFLLEYPKDASLGLFIF